MTHGQKNIKLCNLRCLRSYLFTAHINLQFEQQEKERKINSFRACAPPVRPLLNLITK